MCHPESWGSTRKGLQMQRQRSESQIRQKGSGCTRLRTWSHCCQTRWVYFKGLKRSRNYAKYLNNRVYRCGLRRRGDSFAYRTATAWGCRVRRWMVEKVTGSQSGQVGGGETSVWNSCLQSAEFPFTFGLHFIFHCSRFSWSFLISEALYCSQAGRKSSWEHNRCLFVAKINCMCCIWWHKLNKLKG